MNRKVVSMVGLEENNVVAFYRKPISSSLDWTQMQAIKVRKYWYDILVLRLPAIILCTNNRKIEFYS